jgi:hypothetical protein
LLSPLSSPLTPFTPNPTPLTQAVFSSLFYFAPVALYDGILVAGYATIFTYGPVFSLVSVGGVQSMRTGRQNQFYSPILRFTVQALTHHLQGIPSLPPFSRFFTPVFSLVSVGGIQGYACGGISGSIICLIPF